MGVGECAGQWQSELVEHAASELESMNELCFCSRCMIGGTTSNREIAFERDASLLAMSGF